MTAERLPEGSQEQDSRPIRVLVVNHDIDLADQQADSLRRHGYEVNQCRGPKAFECPILRGDKCGDVEGVDVLVYDAWSAGSDSSSEQLIRGLSELHPEIPLVVTAPGIELAWVETEGERAVVPLVGIPTGDRLHEAITRARSLKENPSP